MDNKIIIAVVLLILVVVAGIFISRMDTDVEPVDVSTEEPSALAEESVNVYFVVVEDGVEDIVSVEREVSAENVEVETVALLLEGPTTTEQAEGYSTAIDEETELIALDIQEGVAYVDFTSELDVDGGSALTMIIDQITETLLQFDSVDKVVIFIEGRFCNTLGRICH